MKWDPYLTPHPQTNFRHIKILYLKGKTVKLEDTFSIGEDFSKLGAGNDFLNKKQKISLSIEKKKKERKR